MNRLRDKVAIITGGAGGIGTACVERFIAEGARVVIADIAEDQARSLAHRLGPSAVAMPYDAGDEASVEAAIRQTVERFGRLDILFNNAAAFDPEVQMGDTTAPNIPLSVWDKTMSVNLRGALLGCRFAIPHMIAAGGGSIINTVSGAGLAADNVRIAYGTSKGALVTFTKYVAAQHGRQGIRCNAIAPGIIVHGKLAQFPQLIEVVKRHVLTPRLGEPRDIAALAAFLAADESAFVTAQTICCDGGYLEHLPQTADMFELDRRMLDAQA